MRRSNLQVFDEVIRAGLDYYTSSRYHVALGHFDTLVIQVVVDKVDVLDAAGTIDVYAEHSGNGRNWDAKNAGVPIVAAAPVTPGLTTTKAATDTSTIFSLALVRLRVRMTTTSEARTRVLVTARDGGP